MSLAVEIIGHSNVLFCAVGTDGGVNGEGDRGGGRHVDAGHNGL